jgi:CubicO group peptidase (beta-lactamase class C family)
MNLFSEEEKMDRARFSRFLVIFAVLTMVCGCGGQKSVSTATATLVPTNTTIPTQTTIPTVAPTPTLSPEAQLASQIDSYVADLTEKGQFCGSILVGREGKVIISKGYGMANLEHNVPNTPYTKFRLGSITKQFTAMAILMLQQEGKLNVQDPICPYFYACPEAWQPITIHHLLTHTSGIYNFTNASDYLDFNNQFASPNTIIDRFRDMPLDFAPGESWSYSNSGYVLLGYIIERISSSYALFLQLNIFEPLGMANTGYDHNRDILPDRAQGYSNSITNADYIDMSVPYAAGGLYSTVEDLFLWDQALYTDKLVSQSLRDEMFTPFVPIPDSPYGYSYGYGWTIGKLFNQQNFSHSGGIEGFVTIIDRYPESKVVIIVLSNLETADVNAISIKIGGMIFGEE